MDDRDLKTKHPDAFPLLDDEQLATVAALAECKTYRDGEMLFRAGDREFKFHVVKSGRIAIVDRSSGTARTLVTHEAREFTGDIANMTGSPASADAVACGDVDVYEICAEELRRIIAERPALSDTILRAFIARWRILTESDFTGIRVIGSRYSPDTFRIRDFLSKNHALFTWTDLENDRQVDELLMRFHVKADETPIVAYANDWMLHNPSNRELAERIGIHAPLREKTYDLAIVGGGPAGLAAAVYGASEGLKTVVLERTAPGGQAGTSSRIENYLGFPMGLSGTELAGRAMLQAQKFGAEMTTASAITRLEFDGAYAVLHTEEGEHVATKCLLIASGIDYRKLDAPGRERFDGAGVYYSATQMEAQQCGGSPVLVVGGGNSAGQAAVFLSENAACVFLLIRNDDLNKSMSRYLSQRIEDSDKIELLTNAEVTRMDGGEHLEAIEVTNNLTHEKRVIPAAALFSFIGASPHTDWLPPEIEKDDKDFVRTGMEVSNSRLWKLKRQPFFLETSRAGVFAAGDVRSGSVKRVASAVGEGAMAVQFAHEYMKEI